MGRIYIFLMFVTLLKIEIIVAQPEPIIIQFVETQPIWEHIIIDTSFYNIGNQPDVNKYTVVKPHQAYRFENDIMILSSCINHRGEDYGYILEQLDIFTGEAKWQTYSTYYNNGIQDYYKNLYLRPDGQLEMIGIKRHGPYIDSSFFAWNIGSRKSNFIRKISNYQNGELVSSMIGNDSLDQVVPSYITFYPIEFDSSYLVVRQAGKELNGTIIWGLDFYQLDQYHNILDTLSISQIIYETTDSVGYFTYGQPPFIKKLDDTTLVALMFKDRFYPNKSEAQLLWISIKDLQDIKVIRRMNVEDLIPGNESSFLYFSFETANNSIYFNQPYYNSEIQTHTTFLTNLDSEGNILHYLPKCTESDPIYEALFLMYSSNEYEYFAGFPSKTGRKGFDVLQLFPNSDSLHYISSLTSAVADEEFTRQMEVCKLYDDGLLLIGAYTKKLGEVQNSAVKYYCFNGADLGMEVSTSIVNLVLNNDVKVFPNPTDGIINFEFDHKFSGRIIVFDIIGNQIGQYAISDSDIFEINLVNAARGMYFVTIVDYNTNSWQSVKIVNVELK